MTIRTLYQLHSKIPPLDFDLLLSYTVHKPKEFFFAHPEYQLTFWQKLKLYYFLLQYKRGLPISYITHHKEFFGLDFLVTKHTLVPRPDTEIMVEEVIKEIQNQKSKIESFILIDIGTGSGCIPIAIMKTVNHKNIKPFAIDISKPALRVSKKNAQRHNVEIDFLHGNLLEPILNNLNSKFQIQNSSLIITANLPYLTQEQFDTESSIQHEPHSALVAEEGGLKLYKELLLQIKEVLAISNLQLTTFFEIDPSQTSLIISEIKKSLPTAQVKVIPDLGGRDRIVSFSTTT